MRAILLIGLLLSLPVWVQAEKNPDPWEGFNRKMFKFNEGMDAYVLRPAAKGYQAVMPEPGRQTVSNIFANVGDVKTMVNSAAQLKPKQAGSDIARFIINSTLGFFGVFDVATHLGLAKHNEDFGQTLGYWGVPSGPYIMWPVLGPSTVRDSVGLGIEYAADISYANLGRNDAEDLSLAVLYGVNVRASLLKSEGMISGDKYVFIRSFYLQHREFLINDGQPQEDFGDDDWDEFDDDWEDDY